MNTGFGAGGVAAPEAFENAFDIGGSDAASSVGDLELEMAATNFGVDADFAAIVDVGAGVVEKIREDDAEFFGVGLKGQLVGDVPLQFGVALLGSGGEHGPAIVEEIGRVDGLHLERELSGIGAGEDEKRFNHGLHALGDGAAFVDGGDVARIVAGARAADVEGGDQRGQRGAELVGYIGGEGFFAGEGGRDADEEAVKFVDDRLELGWGVGGDEAGGEVVFAEMLDVGGEAFNGADRPADNPHQNDAGENDGQAAGDGEQPLEGFEGFVQGGRFGGDGEKNGVGEFGGRAGIADGIAFDGGGEGH